MRMNCQLSDFAGLYALDVYRIDRSSWKPNESITGKVDAHLMSNAYTRSEWLKLTPLLAALHGNTSENFSWALEFYEKFTQLLYVDKL